MTDPFIAYQEPNPPISYTKTESNEIPNSIKRAMNRPRSIKSEEMAIEQKISSIGFAGRGSNSSYYRRCCSNCFIGATLMKVWIIKKMIIIFQNNSRSK